MSRSPRLLVSGYYGFGNAGDEAVLAGLAAGFRQRAPEVELTVLSGDPAATEAEHGVAATPRGLGSARRLARQSDLLVSGGGGLLQDATSWRSPLYYLGVLRLARGAGIPVACVGHGIGPLRRALVRRLTRRALSRVEALAVRDRASEEALRDLGVTREVEVTADLAFVLPRPTQEEVDRAWGKAGLPASPGPAALIALRSPVTAGPRRDLADRLAEAIGSACERLALRAVFVAMQRPHDDEFAARVIDAMSYEADLVTADLSARELLALAGGCDLVIAMRLHALIFAAICGVAPVAISYDPKVDGLMEQLGLQSATSVERFDPDALASAVGQTWLARRQIGSSLVARAEDRRRAALRNIELALDLLPAGGRNGARETGRPENS